MNPAVQDAILFALAPSRIGNIFTREMDHRIDLYLIIKVYLIFVGVPEMFFFYTDVSVQRVNRVPMYCQFFAQGRAY
jgi:hypothetical protein